ncbi:MAG: hypothetical protein U0931_00575 [Vulcanimicrobiota bacterium]
MNVNPNRFARQSNHAGGQLIREEDYPKTNKLPKGMHEAGDAYADQQAHDPYWDNLHVDGYDPRD